MKHRFYIILLSLVSFLGKAQSDGLRSIGFGDVSVIELAPNGNIWIGSFSGGCAAFTAASQTWGEFNQLNSSMKSDSVTSISLYPISGVSHSFMGTPKGVAYKHGTNWDTLPNLINNYVVDIYRSVTDHKLYVATKGGISVFNDTTLVHIVDITSSSTLPTVNITGFQTKNFSGTGFYLATSDSGFYYSPDGIIYNQTFSGNSTLPSNDVNVLLATPVNSTNFAGTKGGLAVCSVGCNVFTTADGLPQNDVTAIDIDCGGNMWVGTRDSGVAIFRGGNWTYVRINDGLPSDRITAINCNAACNCFIGTADGGAVMLDTFAVVSELPSGVKDFSREQLRFTLYPNPTHDVLNFISDKQLSNGELRIFDVAGKLLLTQSVSSNNFSLNLAGLEQGLYIYTIYENKNLLSTGKVSILK